MKRLVLAALLFVPARDLDVGVPPGTPLEWNREFRQPVPTGARGNVPSFDKKPAPAPGSTVAETPKPNLDFVVSNLYDFFRVTTVDIMIHVSVNLPKSTGKVSQDDVATGGGMVMAWNYPPEMPSELVWMAAMACIREQIHPEVVSWPESAAHCLELGEPSLYGAKAYDQGKIGAYLKKHLKPLPAQPPALPKTATPQQALAVRLAAVELTGGFPFALDPTFARRTLGLGEDAYFAVLECTKSPHPFLSRNAVVVLGHFARPETNDELLKLFRESKDPVVRVRALQAILRRGGAKPLVPDLAKLLSTADKDEPMQALAMFALGHVGDPAGAAAVRDHLKRDSDPDTLWTAIPALARIRDASKETKEILARLEQITEGRFKGTDKVQIKPDLNTPSSEEVGAKWKVLHQMAILALAMNGDARQADEVLRRGLDGFHPATHYLLVEALAGMGDKGIELLKKKVIEPLAGEDVVRLEAMRRLAAAKKLDGAYLKDLATGTKGPPVRALALQLLADADEKLAKEACAKIVADYAKGTGDLPPGDAFVAGAAAQVGGRLQAFKAADLVPAVQRAWMAGAFSRREGKNEVDITKAEIKLYPALLESLVVELGRTGEAAGAATLVGVLTKSRAPQGRAEAALALGAVGGREAIDALCGALDDPDGWVRYCAYRSLKAQSGADHFCDWIFGDKGHRQKAAEAYRDWAKTKK
jgi:HEAT repeat protein